MNHKSYVFFLILTLLMGVYPGTGTVTAIAQETPPSTAREAPSTAQEVSSTAREAPSTARETPSAAQETPSAAQQMHPGWNQYENNWYWAETDGNLHKGWFQTDGRTYYMDESGVMVRGWREVDGEWYYFHEDGGMNLGELILDNAQYSFSRTGALVSAGWVENTGGGAYDAGCYDEMTQSVFDQLNEEKKELFFDEYPDREEEYDGDMHRMYDRYAGFKMDMALNKAAAHRLESAMEYGYADDRIPGQGTVNDYLASVPYRKNATCLEVYIRGCEDGDEAFSKVMDRTGERYDSKGDRAYSLDYYRSLGMAHREKDGKHYFMIILMR